MDIAMIRHLSAFAMMIRDGREITVMNQFAKKVVYMDTVKVLKNACEYGTRAKALKMFLKPVWVGKIHGVRVYATHSVRIWWFRNKFSLFQLKRM